MKEIITQIDASDLMAFNSPTMLLDKHYDYLESIISKHGVDIKDHQQISDRCVMNKTQGGGGELLIDDVIVLSWTEHFEKTDTSMAYITKYTEPNL